MGKNNRKAKHTKYISFRCTPTMEVLLNAMAAQSEVPRSTILQILVMEGAEKRKIEIVETEVKNEGA